MRKHHPASIPSTLIPQLLDIEGLQVLLLWLHSVSPTLRKLSKNIVRELCAYVVQGQTVVYVTDLESLYVYDFTTDRGKCVELTLQKSLPIASSSALVNNATVVRCGGCRTAGEGRTSRTVCSAEAFSILLNGKVTKIESMRERRWAHGIAAYRFTVMVFGGAQIHYNKMRALTTCESYDVHCNYWRQLQSLHFPRLWCSVSRLHSRFYIFGGDTCAIEVLTVPSRTVRVAGVTLPGTERCTNFVASGSIVVLQGTHRLVLSPTCDTEAAELTEGDSHYSTDSNTVHWKGKVYCYGGSVLYWIQADNHRVTGTIFAFQRIGERIYT